MKFADAIPLLKGFAGIASTLIPGGPAILAAANLFLPTDKQLPSTATGDQIISSIDGLDSDSKAQLMSKEIDLAIVESNNWSKNVASMNQADGVGASARPYIALMMAWTVLASIVFLMVALFWAIVTSDNDMIKALSDSWELILVALGTPSALLRAYFGMRTKEKHARYAAATNQPIADVVGGFTKIFNRK